MALLAQKLRRFFLSKSVSGFKTKKKVPMATKPRPWGGGGG